MYFVLVIFVPFSAEAIEVLSCDRMVSFSTLTELLLKIVQTFKDYCGVTTEESIRKNFALIYEILDEILVLLSAISLMVKGEWISTVHIK